MRGILPMGQPDEGEGLQHRLPFDVVESPYPVGGQQSLRGIQLHHRPDHPSSAICPGSRGKRVLERHARLLELLGTLLGQSTCHSSAEGVTMPQVLPFCESSQIQGVGNFSREISNAQMFSCLCDQQRRYFVIQQHLQVFVGVACEPCC